jgi:hypothetical protein
VWTPPSGLDYKQFAPATSEAVCLGEEDHPRQCPKELGVGARWLSFSTVTITRSILVSIIIKPNIERVISSFKELY